MPPQPQVPSAASAYGAVQSRYSILSHDTLQHCLSSTNGLENGDRELGHLFCNYRNCKNTFTIPLGECVHFATSISKVRNLVMSPSYIFALKWDTACIHSWPDPSLFVEWVWLVRLPLNHGKRRWDLDDSSATEMTFLINLQWVPYWLTNVCVEALYITKQGWPPPSDARVPVPGLSDCSIAIIMPQWV